MNQRDKLIINESINVIKTLYTPSFERDGNKGTVDNPFENIDEAADYIITLEKEALENNPRHTSGMCFTMDGHKVPSWNLPNIGFNSPEKPDDHFFFNHVACFPGQNRSQRNRFVLKPNLTRRKFLFRGQDKHHVPCVPTLFREEGKDYFLEEMILCQEMEVLLKSHPLVRLFELYGFNLLGIPMELGVNFGGINQHYSTHTRFLDLTSDINVAKFFAVGKYQKEKPHYSPTDLDSDSLGVLYFYDMFPEGCEFQAYAPLGAIVFHLSTMGKQIFPRSGAQKGFLLDMAKWLNFDDIPFVHKVYFRHNRDISKRIIESFEYGNILMPPSILDEYWDEKMSNNRTDRLVSEDALMINLSRNPGETKSSLIRKLKSRGFSICKRNPTFSENQLKKYFQDIKNGWWQDVFCKDISFYGNDGIPYTQAFFNLPKMPDYHKYFYEKSN